MAKRKVKRTPKGTARIISVGKPLEQFPTLKELLKVYAPTSIITEIVDMGDRVKAFIFPPQKPNLPMRNGMWVSYAKES